MDTVLKLLFDHLDSHPAADIRDAVKFLYQACFGGGHLIPDPNVSYVYLCREAANLPQDRTAAEVEDMGDYVRLDLSVLSRITPRTLNAMFVASAKDTPADKSRFIALLDAFAQSGRFDEEKVRTYLHHYSASGYPAVHHSDAYRAAYQPSYRIVRKEFVQYLDAFAAIDARLKVGKPITVAVDGLCGSGKSTLAGTLCAVYDCNLFHADDFFLPAELRTPERYATPGGNVHWERMRSEVLEPLKTGEAFAYRKFDCSAMDYSAPVQVTPKPLSIMEGSYSTHPELLAYYDLKIFLKTNPETQSARILKRDGADYHRMFVEKWIPLENKYFAAFPVEAQCDLVFET